MFPAGGHTRPMADTFFVFQIKVADTQATPSDEQLAFQLAEQVQGLVRRSFSGSPVTTIVDAFTDTAETTISEV